MLRAMIPVMEQHFNIKIDDDAIITAVKSSKRYITGRQLPDKAISVLDTAAARVALSQNAQPAKLDQLHAKLHNLGLELQILQDEQKQNPIHNDRIKNIESEIQQLNTEIEATRSQWQHELETLNKINELQSELSKLQDKENDEASNLTHNNNDSDSKPQIQSKHSKKSLDEQIQQYQDIIKKQEDEIIELLTKVKISSHLNIMVNSNCVEDYIFS